MEEVKQFINILNIGKSVATNKKDESSDEDLTGDQLFKRTFLLEGSSAEICKGDKIRVIKGDLTGINGKVNQID